MVALHCCMYRKHLTCQFTVSNWFNLLAVSLLLSLPPTCDYMPPPPNASARDELLLGKKCLFSEFTQVMENLESHRIYDFNFQAWKFREFKWRSWKVMEKQYDFRKWKGEKIRNLKKLQASWKQALISLEIKTSTYFMHYNARNTHESFVELWKAVETLIYGVCSQHSWFFVFFYNLC